jgi:hypothetical protein
VRSVCVLVSIAALGSVQAAEWKMRDPGTLDGIDALVADDPLLMLTVDGEPGQRKDIRLERIDPVTGLLRKAEYDETGCMPPWRHAVHAESMAPGSSIMWFLTSRMPPGAYVLVDRPAGSNVDWELRGDPFWIVTQPLSRVVPCHDAGGRISIARQPVILAARERVAHATVRIRVGDRVGQGVVVNPWGHVVTARSLVEGADAVRVGFPAMAMGGMGDRVVRYAPIDAATGTEVEATLPGWAAEDEQLVLLAPAEGERMPRFLPTFAPMVDRARLLPDSDLTFRHASWLYTNERGSAVPILLQPTLADGAYAPNLASAADGLITVSGPVGADEIGGPVYDHVGRVWGVLVRPDAAQWSTLVVERYLAWSDDGVLPRLRENAERRTP